MAVSAVFFILPVLASCAGPAPDARSEIPVDEITPVEQDVSTETSLDKTVFVEQDIPAESGVATETLVPQADDCPAPGGSVTESWVGGYSYESVPYDMMEGTTFDQGYEITIYEWEDGLYAYIFTGGIRAPFRKLRAKVLCDGDEAALLFDEYMKGDICGDCFYEKGQVLLRFKRQENELITIWESLRPMLCEEDRGVHFKVDPNVNSNFSPEMHDQIETSTLQAEDYPAPDRSVIESWFGGYSFYESQPPVMEGGIGSSQIYEITIYEWEDGLYAYISLDGIRGPWHKMRAKVLCNSSEAVLLFDEYMKGDMGFGYSSCIKGQILLTFRRQENELITVWGKIQRRSLNEEPGVYFEITPNVNLDFSPEMHDQIEVYRVYG